MSREPGLIGWLGVCAMVACSKAAPAFGPEGGTAPPSVSSGGAATPSASPSAAPRNAPAAEAATYAGTYRTQAGTLYISEEKEYAKVKQPPDDGSLVGEGTFTLAVDATGRATGSVDTGPLAPAVLSATQQGEVMTGTVRRKDASDEGLTGSFTTSLRDGALEGKMELANANASILREAKMTAARK